MVLMLSRSGEPRTRLTRIVEAKLDTTPINASPPSEGRAVVVPVRAKHHVKHTAEAKRRAQHLVECQRWSSIRSGAWA